MTASNIPQISGIEILIVIGIFWLIACTTYYAIKEHHSMNKRHKGKK